MGKLSKVRTRKRGNSYSYIFEAGKKEDGKRKVIEHGGFSSPDDAYNAGVSAYNDWKHGNIGIQSEKICLKEFIIFNDGLIQSMAILLKCLNQQRFSFTVLKNK